jgi:hypothetical protein
MGIMRVWTCNSAIDRGSRAARWAALAAALAGTMIAAPARAEFGEPINLSEAGQSVEAPQVAVDAAGNAVAVWVSYLGTNYWVKARSLSATGALGPVETVFGASPRAESPQVALDGAGNAVIVWRGGASGMIQARTRSAAGVLGPIQNLSPTGQVAFNLQVAFGGAGNAVVVWTTGGFKLVQARTLSTAGVLGPIKNLSRADQNAFAPQVAVDGAGNAVVVWVFDDYPESWVQMRTLSAAGVRGPTRNLSRVHGAAFSPQVAVDAAGNAVVVWNAIDDPDFIIKSWVQARTLSAAGVLGGIKNLTPPLQYADQPQVAVDAAGNAVAIWTRSIGGDSRIQARTVSTGGALGLVKTLSAAGLDAGLSQVAVDGAGNAVVVWQHAPIVQARTRSAAGVLGPVQTLTSDGGGLPAPQLAVNAAGKAVVVWERDNAVIQAAVGP